jgi:hypothetical protein
MAAEAVATDAGDVAWRSGIGTLGDVIAAVGRTYGAARKIATLWNAFVVDPAPALRQRGVTWAIEHLGVTVRVALGREPSRIAARIDGSETWVMAGTFVEVFAQGDGTVLQVRTGTPSVVDRIPRELDPLRMNRHAGGRHGRGADRRGIAAGLRRVALIARSPTATAVRRAILRLHGFDRGQTPPHPERGIGRAA